MNEALGAAIGVFLLAMWFKDDVAKIAEQLKRIADAMEKKQ